MQNPYSESVNKESNSSPVPFSASLSKNSKEETEAVPEEMLLFMEFYISRDHYTKNNQNFTAGGIRINSCPQGR